MIRKKTLMAIAIVAAVIGSGCNGQSKPTPAAASPTTNTERSATLNQQLANIDNNTAMPPEAKEAAKAALMRGAQVAQQEHH